MILVAIVTFSYIYMLYLLWAAEQRRRKWADLALAYSVCYECALDYFTDVPGEGCGTRSRRRAMVESQWVNAREALEIATAELGVEWDD